MWARLHFDHNHFALLASLDGQLFIFCLVEISVTAANIFCCSNLLLERIYLAFSLRKVNMLTVIKSNIGFAGASSSTPITKMIVVNENELWCGCQNEVRIINIKTHDLKSFFPVVNDKARQVNEAFVYLYCKKATQKKKLRLSHS